MATIAVIDYGMGNLRSVSKALERVSNGELVQVTSEPEHIRRADRVVLPGVGAIRDCMSELKRLELIDALIDAAANKPLLGICLGMQALLNHSEENGGIDGLAMFAGRVRHFGDAIGDTRLKVPHMGWNRVRQPRPHPLWRGIDDGSRFYFVHSYYVDADDEATVAGTCDYGIRFSAALARDNVFATQFHPEKSQRAGLELLANFVRWDGTV